MMYLYNIYFIVYRYAFVIDSWEKTLAGSNRSPGPRAVYQKSKFNERPIDGRYQYNNIYIMCMYCRVGIIPPTLPT